MRKRALYYCIFYDISHYDEPNYSRVAYVMVQYSDGSNRHWYPGDRGFKSAKYKALHRDTI